MSRRSLEEFRVGIRNFLAQNLPAAMARRNLGANYSSREDTLDWTGVLARHGWSASHWPPEHGGTGWSPLALHAFDEECFLAGAPRPNIQAISLVGPVIYTFGTSEQQDRFLPDIRNGRVFWAQGFSEPEAGSDLAALRTRAVCDGDDYIVNGQKIWTTQADISDMLFCLVRTADAGKPQNGISFLLIPTDAPGVTVAPIPTIDGQAHLFQTFFDDVRVPVRNRVGDEGKGWTYAKFLLGRERSSVAELPRNKHNFRRLKALAEGSQARGPRPIDNPEMASRIARLETDLLALEGAVIENLRGSDAMSASSIKIRGTELLQAVAQAHVDCLGAVAAIAAPGPAAADGEASPDASGAMSDNLYLRAATIYGGATEIQKNIVARGILQGDDARSGGAPDEQRLLRESAARFAERLDGGGGPGNTGDTATLRRKFADVGWLALTVPESEGGAGLSLADACVVSEELAARLVVEPSLAAHTLGVEILKGIGGAPSRHLLAALAAGDATMAVAYDEGGPRGSADPLSTIAGRTDGGWTIDGQKRFVLQACDATHVMIWARRAGAAGPDSPRDGVLFAVERARPGMTFRPYRLIDGRWAADLDLRAVKVTPDDVWGDAGAHSSILARALDHATIVVCAEALGLMRASLRTTRDYLILRRQFGRRLADFQALQHRLADMFVQMEQSRSIVGMASEALDGDGPGGGRLVNAAKATTGRVAKFIGAQSIQLHGGIGMTSDYVIGRYYKALLATDALFGTESDHLARFGRRAGDGAAGPDGGYFGSL
ncbi:MAG TPA: acyl-CoA dehydrogenase family protein [Rhizomicrobium sp.]